VEPDKLFVEILQDIEMRIGNLDEYGMLRTAALLRQLLLDEPRLIDKVNQQYRLKIGFIVGDRRAYMQMTIGDGAVLYSVEDGLDPERGRPGPTVVLNRDQFLRWPVMFVDGHYVTIHELIDQLAHIEGGVHSGEPRTAKEQALVEASRTLGVGGLPAGIRMIAAIARVALVGLQPLRERAT